MKSNYYGKVILTSVLVLLLFSVGQATNYSLKNIQVLPSKKVAPGQDFMVYGRYEIEDGDYSDVLTTDSLEVVGGDTVVESNNKNNYALTEGVFWAELSAPDEVTMEPVEIEIGDRESKNIFMNVTDKRKKKPDEISLEFESTKDSKNLSFCNIKVKNEHNSTVNVNLTIGNEPIFENEEINSSGNLSKGLITKGLEGWGLEAGANIVPVILEGNVTGDRFAEYDYVVVRNGYTSLEGDHSLQITGDKELNIVRDSTKVFGLKLKNTGVPAKYSFSVEGGLEAKVLDEEAKFEKGETESIDLRITASEKLKGQKRNLYLIAENGGLKLNQTIKVKVTSQHSVKISEVSLDERQPVVGDVITGEIELKNTGDFSEMVHLEAYFKGEDKPVGFGSPVFLDEGKIKTKTLPPLTVPKEKTGDRKLIIRAYGEGFEDDVTESLFIVKESKDFVSGLNPNDIVVSKEGGETDLILASSGTQPNKLNITVKNWKNYELVRKETLLSPGDAERMTIKFNPQEIIGDRRTVEVKVCSVDTGECNTHDLDILLEREKKPVQTQAESIFNLMGRRTKVKPGEGALIKLELMNNHSEEKKYTLAVTKDFEGNVEFSPNSTFSLGAEKSEEAYVFLGTAEDVDEGNYTVGVKVKEEGKVVFEDEVGITLKEEQEAGSLITGTVTYLRSNVPIIGLGILLVAVVVFIYLKKRKGKGGGSYDVYEGRSR